MQLGQIMDKIQKDQQNPTAISEELGAKAGYCACPLHTTLPKGRAHVTPPAPPLDPPLASPHMRNQLTPPWGASKEIWYLLLLPSAAAGAPIKSCLNFLSGFLSVSID